MTRHCTILFTFIYMYILFHLAKEREKKNKRIESNFNQLFSIFSLSICIFRFCVNKTKQILHPCNYLILYYVMSCVYYVCIRTYVEAKVIYEKKCICVVIYYDCYCCCCFFFLFFSILNTYANLIANYRNK